MSRKKEERQKEILSLLQECDEMEVREIASKTGVSAETVRKDLDDLERQGVCKRSHGKARFIFLEGERPLEIRKMDRPVEKERIALRAMEEIQDGQTVYLDAGSTLLLGTELLRSKKDLTVIVNSIPMALEALKFDFRILFLGGTLQKTGLRSEGFFAQSMLEHIHIDLAILGSCGIQGARGFGVYNDSEIGTRDLLVKKAARTIVVLDAHKFNEPSHFEFCFFRDVDTLITNPLNEEQRQQVQEIPHIIEV